MPVEIHKAVVGEALVLNARTFVDVTRNKTDSSGLKATAEDKTALIIFVQGRLPSAPLIAYSLPSVPPTYTTSVKPTHGLATNAFVESTSQILAPVLALMPYTFLLFEATTITPLLVSAGAPSTPPTPAVNDHNNAPELEKAERTPPDDTTNTLPLASITGGVSTELAMLLLQLGATVEHSGPEKGDMKPCRAEYPNCGH